MLKEVVLGVHRTFQGFSVFAIKPPIPRPCCRPLVKHGVWPRFFFFMAIFSPLYICLLRDLIKKVRDIRLKTICD